MTTVPGKTGQPLYPSNHAAAPSQPDQITTNPSLMLNRWLSESVQEGPPNAFLGQESSSQRAERLKKVVREVEKAFPSE
ncbi:hypothetical protein TWF506_003981 [Arthrobotrys conoides]|uniref:Uncharacterized protein n=1 Tax=Arthrobotrys conoides TaxID=74498 RepID=A0AAN8N177_9PEZI